MSLGIGIIGAGVMGGDHARTIARHVAGAHVAAISDVDQARSAAIGGEVGARLLPEPEAVISDPDVGAVLVASPDATHADLVLACFKAGKPVLCEKPLAATSEECLKIVAAEVALGRPLARVGFMRRFDPAYVEMKAALDAGTLGPALLLHCVHRNAVVPAFFDSLMSITNAAVHEIDVARWLLGAELVRAQVFRSAGASASRFRDPLFLVLETAQGQLVDIEVFMNAGYGYDIRGELVCERGVIALAPPVNTEIRAGGVQSFSFARDWRPRFAAAYRIELQSWVNGIAAGRFGGASAWDGYVATAVAEACLHSLDSGQPADIRLAERPRLYA
jgi:myo-inositol 2-dehydrogenase/D-chiro-inositol 1-dehydrogenase